MTKTESLLAKRDALMARMGTAQLIECALMMDQRALTTPRTADESRAYVWILTEIDRRHPEILETCDLFYLDSNSDNWDSKTGAEVTHDALIAHGVLK